MSKYSIYYGKKRLSFVLPNSSTANISQKIKKPRASQRSILKKAINYPLGSPQLTKLARGARSICFVVPDLTRKCPTREIIEIVLKEIKPINKKKISILFALGLHRPLTRAEVNRVLGKKGDSPLFKWHLGYLRQQQKRRLPPLFPVLMHSARRGCVKLGRTRGGIPIVINRHILRQDLIISLGSIEPHHYAGFSGGGKTVVIGCGGEATINTTHNPRFLDRRGVRIGEIKNNPFRKAIDEATRRLPRQFIVNVAQDNKGNVIDAVSGHPKKAFIKGAQRARRIFEKSVTKAADVAVVGVSSPKDVNLYQSSRAVNYVLNTKQPALKRGGTLILAARCPEGIGRGTGEQRFAQAMKKGTVPSGDSPLFPIDKRLRRIKKHSRGGMQRAYFLLKAMKETEIVVVGSKIPGTIRRMGMKAMNNLGKAIDYAVKKNEHARFLVIDDAFSFIVNVKD